MKKKLWHISKRTSIWLYRFFEAFIAFILVVGSLAFWKLYADPMDATFLLPTLSKSLLAEDSEYSLEVDSATLFASFEDVGLFHLSMKNLRLIRPDKTVAINFPKANLSYGLWHILTLNYIPDKLLIDHPDIRVVIDPNGRWLLQAEAQTEQVESKVEETHVAEFPKIRRILQHMLSFYDIEITDGVLLVEDQALKQKLSVPQFDLRLHRRYGGFRHVATFNATTQISDHLTDIKSKATFSRIGHNLNIEIGITPVYISRLGRFVPLLKGIDLPVTISLVADFNTKKNYENFAEGLEQLKFQVKSLEAGKVVLPSPIENEYEVKSVEINGAGSKGVKTIKIAKSEVVLASGVTADVEVSVKGLDDFMKHHKLEKIKTTLTANIKNALVNEVPSLWPKEQGAEAHKWVRTHLLGGKVDAADFSLAFQGGEVSNVFGDIFVSGTKVDYLPNMPALENVSAEVQLSDTKVKIFANSGHAGEVKVVDGEITIAPEHDISHFSLMLNLEGPVSEMLMAINQKPLQLLKNINLDWTSILGNADARVQLDFPLDEESFSEGFLVDVRATGKDLGMPIPLVPLTLSNGSGDLHVTNEGLVFQGQIALENQPLDVVWKEDFTPVKGTNGVYQVSGEVEMLSLQNLIPNIESYIVGVVPFKAELERIAPNSSWKGSALLTLDEAETVLYPLSVTKKAKEQANIKIDLEQANTSFTKGKGLFNISGTAMNEKLLAKGRLEWGKEWKLVLDDVSAKDNSFKGEMSYGKDSLKLQLLGESWNLSELKNMPFSKKEKAVETSTILPTNIDVKVDLKKLILNPEKPTENIVIKGKRTSNVLSEFYAQAWMGEPSIIFYNAENKTISGSLVDLGALMSYLNISDRFSKGEVVLNATQNEKGEVAGKIMVTKTELNETGFMLQALTILGIVDALRGKNIVFDEIHIPFQFSPEGSFKLENAYAASSNIGVTFHGLVNLDKIDFMEYANSMLKLGNEYESVYDLVNATNLVIGEVVECIPHPESDHLHICKVNVGKEVFPFFISSIIFPVIVITL